MTTPDHKKRPLSPHLTSHSENGSNEPTLPSHPIDSQVLIEVRTMLSGNWFLNVPVFQAFLVVAKLNDMTTVVDLFNRIYSFSPVQLMLVWIAIICICCFCYTILCRMPDYPGVLLLRTSVKCVVWMLLVAAGPLMDTVFTGSRYHPSKLWCICSTANTISL